jgi:hypothetical protein
MRDRLVDWANENEMSISLQQLIHVTILHHTTPNMFKGFQLKEDELPNKEPTENMIKEQIANVEGGQEIAERILADYVKAAKEYEKQMQEHPNEPKHPAVRDAMKESAKLIREWKTVFHLPFINLKQRGDGARRMGLEEQLPQGRSIFRSSLEDETDEDVYTMSGGRSGFSGSLKRSAVTQGGPGLEPKDIMPEPLDFQVWLKSWIAKQSDADKLQGLPEHIEGYLFWVANANERTPTSLGIQDSMDRDHILYMESAAARARVRALKAYETYTQRFRAAAELAVTAHTESLADTADTKSLANTVEIGTKDLSNGGTQVSFNTLGGADSAECSGQNTTVNSGDGKTAAE